MGRPAKTGLDYFPVDTSWETNMKLVKARFPGFVGVGCVSELWRWIYREGYVLRWDEDTQLLFSAENGIALEDVQKIVAFAVEKGIFSREILEKTGMLTSHGIQKRWKMIATESNRKNSQILPEVNLLEFPPEETGLSGGETGLSGGEMPQSKGKESKVKTRANIGSEAKLDPVFAAAEKSAPETYDPSEYQTPPEPEPDPFVTHPYVPGLKIPRALAFTGEQLRELQGIFGNRSQEALEVIAEAFAAKDYGYKSTWAGVKTWFRKEASPVAWLDRQTGKAKPESGVRPEIYRAFQPDPEPVPSDAVDPLDLEQTLRMAMRPAFSTG